MTIVYRKHFVIKLTSHKLHMQQISIKSKVHYTIQDQTTTNEISQHNPSKTRIHTDPD